ncbi:MAG: DUF2892 domain-containing protein [Gammaproteobacteria bacterium]|nr:DUF2892 domain-containing protein [Gammaproteobacteria bacterium]
MELPTTADRVPQHTSDVTNHALRLSTKKDLAYYRDHPQEIDQRLQVLEKEWDIERALEANAASVILAGVGLAVFVSRRFLFVPGIVAGFLLQHALQGWCPPLPLLRRLGFRTEREIDGERQGLKTIRRRTQEGRSDYQPGARSDNTTVPH